MIGESFMNTLKPKQYQTLKSPGIWNYSSSSSRSKWRMQKLQEEFLGWGKSPGKSRPRSIMHKKTKSWDIAEMFKSDEDWWKLKKQSWGHSLDPFESLKWEIQNLKYKNFAL